MQTLGDIFKGGWSQPRPAAFPPLRAVQTGSMMRNPDAAELMFFRSNPGVSGMATQDGNVIFSPDFEANANPVQKQGLFMLESARNHMRNDDAWKGVTLTQEQEAFFRSMKDPYYSQLGDAAKQTLISRIVGGDIIPGAPYTPEQEAIADGILRRMTGR